MNIGQAATASGVSSKMIRHYESIGLLPSPPRTASGYRTYSQSSVHVLRFVKRARSLGFSLDRIKVLLSLWQDKSRASSDVKRIATAHVEEMSDKIAALSAMRDTLQELVDHCHGNDRPDCPIITGMECSGEYRAASHHQTNKT
jgi:MerR family transcriptional regulator, copper efflux regulator